VVLQRHGSAVQVVHIVLTSAVGVHCRSKAAWQQ
jgi:hypothetical protein